MGQDESVTTEQCSNFNIEINYPHIISGAAIVTLVDSIAEIMKEELLTFLLENVEIDPRLLIRNLNRNKRKFVAIRYASSQSFIVEILAVPAIYLLDKTLGASISEAYKKTVFHEKLVKALQTNLEILLKKKAGKIIKYVSHSVNGIEIHVDE